MSDFPEHILNAAKHAVGSMNQNQNDGPVDLANGTGWQAIAGSKECLQVLGNHAANLRRDAQGLGI